MLQPATFFTSFERYGRQVLTRSPVPYSYLGIGMVLTSFLVSFTAFSTSLVPAKNPSEVIERATYHGDYDLAEKVYLVSGAHVLGATSELENLIYPERSVEQYIDATERSLIQYPENRQIYLLLSQLYALLENQTVADEYAERARILAPND